MKLYTYKFADGTTSTVEVEDDFYEILDQMDKDQRNQNRRETRKHDSYEWLEEQCVEPGMTDDYFVKEAFLNMDNEKLRAAIAELPPSQQEVLRLRFYEDKNLPEIAEVLGCSVAAIYKRYERIIKKSRNFLGIVENEPLPWL